MNKEQLSSRLNAAFSQGRSVKQVAKRFGLPDRVVQEWQKQWAHQEPYVFDNIALVSPEVVDKISRLKAEGDTSEQIAASVGLRPEIVAAQKGVTALSKEEQEKLDPEVVKEFLRVTRTNQRLMDRNRIERKTYRAQARYDNAAESLLSEVLGLMQKNSYHYGTFPALQAVKTGKKSVGVLQLSDLHFNELISIVGNRFDFSVAASRLRLFERDATRIFKAWGITEVVVAMTGDMLNSDRRLDEIVSAATNRAQALFLAGDIMQQFLASLRQNFRLHVAYVTGNESRNGDTIGWTKQVATDNYDTLLFHLLQRQFAGVDGITFVEEDDNEQMLEINHCWFLLMHGHGKMEHNVEQNVTKAIGRYAAKGVLVDYVLLGHLHSARVGDFCARSSSLAGPNAYSEQALNLIGRASQNAFVVDSEKRIHGFKIDLQYTEDITDAYQIDNQLTAYNAKSAEKARIHGFAPYKVGC